MKFWHISRRLMFFLIAFASTVALVSHLSGLPEFGLLKKKLNYFELHKDEYEIIFVGSSRVYRGIIPTVFDREMFSLGQPVKSFNFAISGMKAHEANALIRRVLAMYPSRLHWVVVEAGEWDPVIHKKNRFKRRGIFWHDASETWSAFGSSLRHEATLGARVDLLATHALHFATRSLAIGRGPDVVRSLLQDEEPTIDPLICEWRGFKPYTETSYKYNPLRKRFLKNLQAYRDAVSRRRDVEAPLQPRRSYNRAAVHDQVAMIRRAGVQPVHLITPTPHATPEIDSLTRESHVEALLAFNDPKAYPELFAIERRFDDEHLTQEGALLFTRLLASRFVAEVVANDSRAAR